MAKARKKVFKLQKKGNALNMSKLGKVLKKGGGGSYKGRAATGGGGK